jgi:hypothetical protein
VIARNLHDMYDHFEEEAQAEIQLLGTSASMPQSAKKPPAK